jgi:hypothetical protein
LEAKRLVDDERLCAQRLKGWINMVPDDVIFMVASVWQFSYVAVVSILGSDGREGMLFLGNQLGFISLDTLLAFTGAMLSLPRMTHAHGDGVQACVIFGAFLFCALLFFLMCPQCVLEVEFVKQVSSSPSLAAFPRCAPGAYL